MKNNLKNIILLEKEGSFFGKPLIPLSLTFLTKEGELFDYIVKHMGAENLKDSFIKEREQMYADLGEELEDNYKIKLENQLEQFKKDLDNSTFEIEIKLRYKKYE